MITVPSLRLPFLVIALVVLAGWALSSEKSEGPLPPVGLRCEYLTDPAAVDVARPCLSWELRHSERGQAQTAYQVLVASDPAVQTGDVWDSGRVESANSIQVLFSGKALERDTPYFWRVRFWDKDQKVSAWSDVARFETGLLAAGDWRAEWIGNRGQLRKEFRIEKPLKRARAHICGLGYYELRLNGRKVGRNVLDPGWTTYKKRVLYVSYEVTSILRQGPNAVAVMLGQGWYKSRALLFQLNLEFTDGTRAAIVSDGSWKVTDGPVVADSIYNGETYDARRETPGWDRSGHDDSLWAVAEPVQGPSGILSAQAMPPIQVVDTLIPQKLSVPAAGVYVFDMGQNFSGWARLRVRGPAGVAVRLRFAELLYPDGRINQENLRSARAEDVYILKGEGEEIWEPRFTYHGFRYVELTGFPGVPTLETIRGRVVHSAVPQTGSFACSNPLLNQLQHIVVWGQKTNLHSVPTDCCQRDERMGWMGDAHGTAEEALMNFDMAAFYTNFVRDMRDVQDEQGRITDTVPHIWGSRPADPAWGTAYPLICWYLYKYLGDVRLLEEQYEGIKKYVEFLRTKEEDGLVAYSYYGDWVAVEKAPGDLVSAFFYLYDVEVLRDMARVLDKTQDVQEYSRLASAIRKRFQEKYYDPKMQSYGDGTQGANALPLFLDIPGKELRGGVFESLRNDILYRHDTHLTTGIMGTKYIMEVLTRFDASDLAYELAAQTTYPSWGYMIANGATTLWELWQKKEGPSMNSHNHPMFGSVGSWLYKALAGIDQAQDSVAFERLRIAPQTVRDLRYAAGSIRTLRGPVSVSWERSERSLRCDVAVPVGSRAEIVLPVFNWTNITLKEGESMIWSGGAFKPGAAGICDVKGERYALAISAGSGSYSFILKGE